MTSLLARLPGRGPSARDGGGRRAVHPAGLAALTALAVPVVGVLGLALALVVVAALDPDGGLSLGENARLAGQLWLLAQGGRLDLASGPLAIAPLLLTLGAAWGLSRAVRSVVAGADLRDARPVGQVLGAVVVVHLAGTAALAALVDTPGARVALVPVLTGALLLVLAAGGWGALRESGLAGALADRVPGPARALARGALAGLLTLLALALVVVAVALASDARGAAALATGLGGAGAGAVGLLGLGALLLPNAAAAVLGLAAGPGFLVGAGTLVSTGGVTLGAVPALPLLAALPDTQAVPLLAFLSQALPVLAGLVTGVALARRLTLVDGGALTAALWGVVAGVGVGVLAGLVVAAGSGQLGDGGLAEVGAPPLATGLAIAAQAGLAAAVSAAVTRWRRSS